MEAARKSDEAREAVAAADPTPAPNISEAAETKMERDLSSPPSAVQLPALPEVNAIAPTKPAHSAAAAPAPQPVPVLLPGVASRPQVDEMLICSAQGEVLYEWQCQDRDRWVNFFEFVSQRGQRLTQSLPVGEFDRLEVVSGGARAVVIISADRGVLVKTRRAALNR
jgi:hypothetical protein